MKKLIATIFCLFLTIPCFPLDTHISHVIDNINTTIHGNQRYGYKGTKVQSLTGAIIKLGIGYWGFKQENAYGNVTGSLFALSGIIQITMIRW